MDGIVHYIEDDAIFLPDRVLIAAGLDQVPNAFLDARSASNHLLEEQFAFGRPGEHNATNLPIIVPLDENAAIGQYLNPASLVVLKLPVPFLFRIASTHAFGLYALSLEGTRKVAAMIDG